MSPKGPITDEELRNLEVCSDRPVPEDKFVDAAVRAIEENPDNAPRHNAPSGMGVDPQGPLEMALVTEKRWRPGRTLRVKFLNGEHSVQTKVVDYAKQWERHANLELEFVENGESEIRISFDRSGSWSYLGTVALVIDADEPTMNYGWLTPASTDEEYSRVVLHEFGHALACIHEHQHPQAGIPWDREKVYRYYSVTNGWPREKTDRNVLKRYSRDSTNFSDYDSTSIMQYAVPNGLTIGDFEIGWNTELSSTDTEFIGTMYPRDQREVRELSPDVALEAAIGEYGEEDHYSFSVAELSSFDLETRGDTDVVMALYGPDDNTNMLATDDDSGLSLNAKISAALTPGDYLVRVRHYSATGQGDYSIQLTRVP
jgi:hypothetical protein